MPLLKQEALRFSADEIHVLRQRLAEPFDHELVVRDGRRYLFVRCSGEPDPVVDLERGLAEAPAWALRDLDDIFLLGERGDLHVPARIAAPAIDAQLRLDQDIARAARAILDPHYGVRLHRFAADPRNVERLLVRVPRDRCAELTETDLVEIAQRVGPLHDEGRLVPVRACHLVAEQDGVRFRARDFLSDLLERWRALREAPFAPVPEPAPLPPPAPAPRRVEDVTPLFEIHAEVDATPAVEPAFAVFGSPDLPAALERSGFEVRASPAGTFDVVAERSLAYPRHVAAITRPRLDRPEADEALRLAREHGLDVLLIVAGAATPEAERRLAASNVRIVAPDALSTLRL